MKVFVTGVLGFVGRHLAPALAARGHEVGWWPDLDWRAGCVCAIVKDPASGVLSAGADPRRPAYALGW